MRTTIAGMVLALEKACRWVEAKRNGTPEADRFIEAARTEATITLERLGRSGFPVFCAAAQKPLRRIAAIANLTDVTGAVQEAATVPVPPLLVATQDPYDGSGRSKAEKEPKKADGPFAIRVMLTLDGKAWANPQALQPATLYDVGLTLTVPQWPEGADTLQLDYVTTLPSDAYRVSSFRFSRSQFDAAGEVTAKGHLEFQSGQSLLSEPVALQMRATFLNTADPKFAKTATVIGYHKLRAKVTDSKQTPLLSKYRALDARIVDIVEELRQLKGLDEAHLSDFITVLGPLVNYMGICAQQAV